MKLVAEEEVELEFRCDVVYMRRNGVFLKRVSRLHAKATTEECVSRKSLANCCFEEGDEFMVKSTLQ